MLGIVGTVLGLIPILGIPALAVGLVGVVFGGLALGRVRNRIATNKAMSWWGLSLSLVAVALGIAGIVIVQGALDDLGDKLNDLNNKPNPTYSYTP